MNSEVRKQRARALAAASPELAEALRAFAREEEPRDQRYGEPAPIPRHNDQEAP
jgi:hypothetical protein